MSAAPELALLAEKALAALATHQPICVSESHSLLHDLRTAHEQYRPQLIEPPQQQIPAIEMKAEYAGRGGE